MTHGLQQMGLAGAPFAVQPQALESGPGTLQAVDELAVGSGDEALERAPLTHHQRQDRLLVHGAAPAAWRRLRSSARVRRLQTITYWAPVTTPKTPTSTNPQGFAILAV